VQIWTNRRASDIGVLRTGANSVIPASVGAGRCGLMRLSGLVI